MKIFRYFIIAVLLTTIVTGLTSFTEPVKIPIKGEDDGDERSEPQIYWFYLRIKVNKRKKAYTIIGTGSRVVSGTIDEFEKGLWWGTKAGQMAIGPFLKHKEATEARLLYRRKRKKILRPSAVRDEQHWFLVTFKVRERSKAFKLQRMPARLASGSQGEFLDALYEGMTFQHLAIGPFWDYVQAEEAKALYRKNE